MSLLPQMYRLLSKAEMLKNEYYITQINLPGAMTLKKVLGLRPNP